MPQEKWQNKYIKCPCNLWLSLCSWRRNIWVKIHSHSPPTAAFLCPAGQNVHGLKRTKIEGKEKGEKINNVPHTHEFIQICFYNYHLPAILLSTGCLLQNKEVGSLRTFNLVRKRVCNQQSSIINIFFSPMSVHICYVVHIVIKGRLDKASNLATIPRWVRSLQERVS